MLSTLEHLDRLISSYRTQVESTPRMTEGRKDDSSSDRVDVQSIGSISSLRSRFENADVTASTHNRPAQPIPFRHSKPSTTGLPVTNSAPRIMSSSPAPISTPPSRPRTPEPLLVPKITEQAPSPSPTPVSQEGPSHSTIRDASPTKSEIKKKPPPPIPASMASRNRRRSTDTRDDRFDGLSKTFRDSVSTEAGPISSTSLLVDNGGEEPAALASSPEEIRSVSALRNKFNQAEPVSTSSRGPSRPVSPQPGQPSSSGIAVVKPKPVPPPPRSQARPRDASSGGLGNAELSAKIAMQDTVGDTSSLRTGTILGNLGPPPPPPLHSRPRTEIPKVVNERDGTNSSIDSEIGSMDDLSAVASEAMSSTYSRSPQPMMLSIPPANHGPALSPPLPTDFTASPNLKPRIASVPVPAPSSTSGGLQGTDSHSNAPVLPPRQSSGQHQALSGISTSAPSAAPALPPRTAGPNMPTTSHAPPTLPDRDRGLSRSASVAVGRSDGQAGHEHGHSGRESLKRMVKRSNTLLHRPSHLHRRREAGEGEDGHFDRTEELMKDAREYVPPPPPTRSQASGTTTAAPTVPRATRSYDSEEEQIDEDDQEGGEDKAETLDEIAHSATYSGSKTLANSKLSANRALAEYPDSTRVNRRAPDFVPRQRLTASNHSHSFAVSGHKLCTGGNSVKVYDMTLGDSRPIFVSEPRTIGLETKGKDTKVTALSFRSPGLPDDEGRFLWCGTNGGHLWELDIMTGEVTDIKAALHASSITHLFRHNEWMVSLDELGKVNVFGPFTTEHEALKRQTSAPCRTLRTADRQNFAAMLGGQLWTASGPAARSTTNSALRGPTLRVYDPTGTTSGNTAGKTTFTSEWTGAVTAATVDPFDNQSVYLAHEGGYVSIFDRASLACQSVLKISPTDILGLEYVGDYLWAGNRSGVVNVYDTRTTPWTTINTWMAHPYVMDQKSIVPSSRTF